MPIIAVILVVAIVYVGTWSIAAIGKQADADMHEALWEKENHEKH